MPPASKAFKPDPRLDQVLAKTILGYAAPIFWRTGATVGGMDDRLTNGTTFFLDCGQGAFGVTAGHVYEDHQAHVEATGIRCQLGLGPRHRQMSFDLRERLIMHTTFPDIATYRVSPDEIRHLGIPVVTSLSWPPPKLKHGDHLAFAGFPGADRTIDSPGNLSFEPMFGTGRVDSLSDASIACVRPEDAIRIADWRFPRPNYPTGGMSGGPLFYVDPDARILTLPLVGIISAGEGKYEGEGDPIDLLRFARADLINADGTINEIPRGRSHRRHE